MLIDGWPASRARRGAAGKSASVGIKAVKPEDAVCQVRTHLVGTACTTLGAAVEVYLPLPPLLQLLYRGAL